MSGKRKAPSAGGLQADSLDLGLSILQTSVHGTALRLREIADDPPAPPRRAPSRRYQLLQEISSDQAGRLYAAFDADLCRNVTVKVVRAGDEPRAPGPAGGLAEARVAAQLEHPNAPPVHDIGVNDQGDLYYTTRRVRGRTLEGILRAVEGQDREARKTYTRTRLLQVLRQACWAVEYAHHRNVVHGHVGPANILVGAFGEVLVLGWGQGVARHAEGAPTPEKDVHALECILRLILGPASPAAHSAPRVPEGLRTAREMGEAVQALLESEEEQAARKAEAMSRAADGRLFERQYAGLLRAIRRSEDDVERLSGTFKRHDDFETRRPLYEEQDRTERLRAEAAEAFNRAVNSLTEALGYDPANGDARGRLADLYYGRYVDAGKRHDEESASFFRNLVERYHDGKYAAELHGTARLLLETTPPGARVLLRRYVEKDLVLVPARPVDLGRTPVAAEGLQAGSYLVEITRPGFRTCRYPVLLRCGAAWEGRVALYADKEIGVGFVFVPGGPYLAGGDPEAQASEDGHVRRLHDFFIMDRHVTNAEYLEFIHDLDRRGVKDVDARTPCLKGGAPYWTRNDAGVFVLPPAEGGEYLPDWPVFAICYRDATAYARWRSRRDGRAYALPTADEWEKASGGVDGRIYPWGNHWDFSLCNAELSRRTPSPVPVKSFPMDCSPYGMYDAAGNVSEWTRDMVADGSLRPVLRGGCWESRSRRARVASRSFISRDKRVTFVGFRLVHYPLRAAPGQTPRPNRPRHWRNFQRARPGRP